jgi:hypothetical protein
MLPQADAAADAAHSGPDRDAVPHPHWVAEPAAVSDAFTRAHLGAHPSADDDALPCAHHHVGDPVVAGLGTRGMSGMMMMMMVMMI